MNTIVLKIYLKSNSTYKSKLNSKCTKLYNSLFTSTFIIAKRERDDDDDRYLLAPVATWIQQNLKST